MCIRVAWRVRLTKRAFGWAADLRSSPCLLVQLHCTFGQGVLVLWQLATMQRSFLPRLGSRLVSVSASPDGLLYTVGARFLALRGEGHRQCREERFWRARTC